MNFPWIISIFLISISIFEKVGVVKGQDEEVVDCGVVCEARLVEVFARIDDLQSELQTLNETTLYRITNLETNYYNVLSDRVDTLASDLNLKIDNLSTRLDEISGGTGSNDLVIDNKIADSELKLRGEITDLKESIETTIASTQEELQNLEKGKVQILLNHNELWKRNFRIVNNTFVQMRKRFNIVSTNKNAKKTGIRFS